MKGVLGRHDMSACAKIVAAQWRGCILNVRSSSSSSLVVRLSAETLEQALADAYLINPVLNAERARLRATDEQVALAKSGLRPFISTIGDYAFMNTDNDVSRPAGTTALGNLAGISSAGGFPTGTSHPRGWSVQLTQPLFEGFQNLNAIRQAKSTVQAARESLAHRRADRPSRCHDRLCERRARHGHRPLARERREGADRAAQGDQGPVRCRRGDAHRRGTGRGPPLGGVSTLAAAQANLKTSRAAYEQIIGHPPGATS